MAQCAISYNDDDEDDDADVDADADADADVDDDGENGSVGESNWRSHSWPWCLGLVPRPQGVCQKYIPPPR